jgi:S1-C subfamily serine protease
MATLLLGSWFLQACVSHVSGQEPGAAASAVQTLAEHGLKCAVGISCKRDGYQSFFGTGAVITADGYIITSTTVVPPRAEEIEVSFQGFVNRPAKLIEANETLEATIIKVEADNLPFLSLAREIPRVGEPAYTLSNANNVLRLSGTASFSRGLISGIYDVQNIGGESLYAGQAIETTAAVNPGSDGGPIVNELGQLCGVISLNVSASRWQGIGVPTKVLLEQLSALKNSALKVTYAPLPGRAPPAELMTDLGRQAQQVAPFVVGIQVQRHFAPEVLPRMSVEKYCEQIPNWEQKSTLERSAFLRNYFDISRILEVNQMLRRPKQPSSGIVVSADGHILTSSFNVEDDPIFIEKRTGIPRGFTFPLAADELFKEPEGGYDRGINAVQSITVMLPDGSQHEAKVLARHLPMGVALLKIEKANLPFLDIAKQGSPPQLGIPVGLMGSVPGGHTQYTLNSGIVSAAVRNRGFQFQTDALLNYGNSGGPVIDETGRFIGLATSPIEPRTALGRVFNAQELNFFSIAPNSGVSMVARADRLVDALEKLKRGESTLVIPGPYLGVGPDPNRVLGKDVLIGSIAPGAPAAQAGLQVGDQLLTLNGEELATWKDLIEHLQNFQPGEKVTLKVRRAGITRRLMINGKPVSNESELQELMKSLKPSEKFEGTMVAEDTKEVTVTLGERK